LENRSKQRKIVGAFVGISAGSAFKPLILMGGVNPLGGSKRIALYLSYCNQNGNMVEFQA
jgi:hypothetical protein